MTPHSDPQRAAFKAAYGTRLRNKIVMIVLTVLAMASLAITKDSTIVFGLPMAVVGPISFVALVIGWWVLEDRNWRCPACNEYLGRALNPKHCHRCGVELRG